MTDKMLIRPLFTDAVRRGLCYDCGADIQNYTPPSPNGGALPDTPYCVECKRRHARRWAQMDKGE